MRWGITLEDVAERRIAECQATRNSSLDLRGLGLTRLPDGVRGLGNLAALDLSDNGIRELPSWIGELAALRTLEIPNNQLTSLPPEICRLDLVGLDIRNNQLAGLPERLNGDTLQDLLLDGNPELEIPASILAAPPKQILSYYFEAHTDDGRPLGELKLLLVGMGRAGKTTLLRQLVSEKPLENEPETHSIDIREFSIQCPKGSVQTRAWDFGGQEFLHSTHQFFLTERSLYLVVLEPRTGQAQRDAEYWLRLIETQGGRSPTIVVLNWSHQRPWKVDQVRLLRMFPFIVAFVATDALHGDGLVELRQAMVEAIQERMPDVWLGFPNRWRQIKEELARMQVAFLTYKTYTERCRELGEERPEAQANLAEILHSLGLVLYFGKDPRLHDTRVLKPSWVTGGVYAVIRSPSVAARDGQLSLADMPQVLKEAEEQKAVRAADYPPETHQFILELMRAFQLCYASQEEPGKPTRYLVPELLPAFEPAMADPWESAPVRLRYIYDITVIPLLLPRFIVRTHALSDGEPHWRHGVVLRHADAKALIRVEIDRGELHVFVIGEKYETRRAFVGMVRRELEAMHQEMKIQPVEEMALAGDDDRWIGVKALHEMEQPPAPAVQRLPVKPEGTADVNVAVELDKLVPPTARAIDREPTTAPPPVRLFVCYAHSDERQLKRLDLMLDVLEQQHGLEPWMDKRRLISGDQWEDEIQRRLEEMDIFLLIASQASMASRYVQDTELRRARERKVEIAVVKLEACSCDDHEFLGKVQRLAAKYKSVANANPRSEAWEQVRRDLLQLIAKVVKRKQIQR
jgi:internalin A